MKQKPTTAERRGLLMLGSGLVPCPTCGESVRLRAYKCNNCGTRLYRGKAVPTAGAVRSKTRPITVVLIAVNVAFALWVYLGFQSATQTCGSSDACTTGAGLGVMLILAFAAIVNVPLLIIWATTRDRTPPATVNAPAEPTFSHCIACGKRLLSGAAFCAHCGAPAPSST